MMESEMDESAAEALKKEIEARGGPDRYIDQEEEDFIFTHGVKLGMSHANVEAILNHLCRSGDWTREHDILKDLYDILEETTRDDGAIDKKEFEHCVNYAVAMRMPRKRAMELSVRFVQDKDLKIKKRFFGGDWFAPLRDMYSS